MAGVALGLTRSYKVQLRVMKELAKEWREIDRTTLTRSTNVLYRSKLVQRKTHKDGSVTLVLTDAGKKQALRYNLDTLSIPKQRKWDGKWRIVMYDIPEDLRDLRIELLGKLKHLGFVELQHSVFVHPYECRDQIEYLIEAYGAREYIRRMVVEEIDDAGPLRKHFKLHSGAGSIRTRQLQ
jgi:DNA-binding transcriptional regulator PaaX